MNSQYIRCKRCVMDNKSDETISFDERGYCNYCTDAIELGKHIYFPNETGAKMLSELIEKIKAEGKNRKYDCVIGISGGLDSSYLAYLASSWDLRVLAVHIDDGFDTDISKQNIRKLIEKTGFDYEVITPDAEQFADLTVAYMKAGVPNIAIPQDNILFAFLYAKMKEYGIRYFLTGGNYALECILQCGNTHKATDLTNLKDIHRKFGTKTINKLKFISTISGELQRMLLHINTVRPLNLVDYNRARAFEELKLFCGFEYYGRKHLENILTAFIQLVWFPQKFGVDKRTSHLSSMIVSGQMTREEAIEELNEPIYDAVLMDEYIRIIKSKLQISDSDFSELMKVPCHDHTEYKTEDQRILYKMLKGVRSLFK